MTTTETPRTPIDTAARKPRDDEIDVFGLTHPGKVRAVNQDHFLICSLQKKLQVQLTSLPNVERLPLDMQRMAFLAMVADGVGGGAMGEEASRLALERVSEYVARCMNCYYSSDATDEEAFTRELQDAAMRCHQDLLKRAEEDSDTLGMATTLTVWLGVWPRAYLLHVGDSRCYILRDDKLVQLSRDQTMAQELVDLGVLKAAEASTTKWANVLSSSIGGPQTAPVVYQMEQRWGQSGLLCSDGLTRHVSDEQIRDRLMSMTSSRQVCEQLLQDALDGGGTDNITIVVGRTIQKPQEWRGA